MTGFLPEESLPGKIVQNTVNDPKSVPKTGDFSGDRKDL